jgi:hypothetical protein
MRSRALAILLGLGLAGCGVQADTGGSSGAEGGAGGLEGAGGGGGGGTAPAPCGGIRYAPCDDDSPDWMSGRCVLGCDNPQTCEYNWADCVDGCFVCPDGWVDMYLCGWDHLPGEG